MDAYVVLHFKGTGATVIGAGADSASAHVIADRHGGGQQWWPWERQEHLGREIRHSDLTHEYQTIIRVPLAGYSGIDFPISPETSRMLEADRARAAARRRFDQIVLDSAALSAAGEPPTLDRMREIMEQFRPARFERGPIRCGSGAAWDWLRSGLDQVATYPSEKALPDSVAARILGIDVRLDPNMPPDMIRLGSKLWKIDGERVLMVDLDELARAGMRSPTTPPA